MGRRKGVAAAAGNECEGDGGAPRPSGPVSVHAMRPLIGISAWAREADLGGGPARYQLVTTAYVRAVEMAGGLPVVLPVADPTSAALLLDRIDGLVVTGGGDVDPSWYGSEPGDDLVDVDTERDASDLELVRRAVERNHPTLAICRGSQVLNVALGGTLDQRRSGHDEVARYNEEVHVVRLEPASRLAARAGTQELRVNSLHRQAIDAVADDARAVASAPDGTVEAIEVVAADRVLGVQWHPELLRHRPEHLALFERLVADATR